MLQKTLLHLKHRVASLFADRRGNVALVSAISLPVLVCGVGLAVDFSDGASMKSRLTNAADAAVLAGLRAGSEAKKAGKGNWVNIAQTEATNFFRNYVATEKVENIAFDPTYVDKGAQLVGEAKYRYEQRTMMMGMFGLPTMTIAQAPQASIGDTSYIDVTFVIDNSASMGIGATLADRNIMNLANGNCAFACHQSSSPYGLRFNTKFIHTLGAKVRIDVVREAILQAMDDIAARNPIAGQVQFSAYTFSQEIDTLLAPQTNIATAKAAIAKLDMTEGAVAWRRYGSTQVTSTLKTVANELKSRPGNGSGSSPTNRKRFVVFVSDGVEDTGNFQTNGINKIGLDAFWQGLLGLATVPYFGWWDNTRAANWVDHPLVQLTSAGAYMQPFVQDGCAAIKKEKATILTGQIKYETAGIVQRAGDVVKINYIQSVKPDIEKAFQSCATEPSLAFQAETTSDIKPMLDRLIEEIVPPGQMRLTQ